MTSIRLTDAGPRAVASPQPSPGRGEVVVATRAAAITRNDLDAQSGLVMCSEFSGHVTDVGADVDRDLIGKPVAAAGHRACGSCPRCAAGFTSACADFGTRGETIEGGFADAVVARADEVFPLPPGLSMESAVFMHRAALALHAIRRGPARPGDDVAIIGSTPLALAVSAVARSAGFGRVAAIEDHACCRRALADAGVHVLETPTDGAEWEGLAAWFGGFGPDVVFECAGTPTCRLAAIELVRPAGSIVLLADNSDRVPMDINLLVMGDKRVQGARGYSADEARAALELIARARVDTSALVGDCMGIEKFLATSAEDSLGEVMTGCQASLVTWPAGATLPQVSAL